MPGTIDLWVEEARGLPVMDTPTKSTDAFVEVRYGSTLRPTIMLTGQFRTPVAKHTLNPVWGPHRGGHFQLDVGDDCLLQDAPLELRVYDHDKFSAHDIIGVVYVDLNPLLHSGAESDGSGGQDTIQGWFPIFDTLRGARGQLHVKVKISFFSNASETRTDTSAGVRFFSSTAAPECFEVERVFGFVEELLVKDDPEHAALEKIRSARFTNTERQGLLGRLSGELRRQLGRKALNVGANAVLGFVKELDLEGGDLVARGYGAAVLLKPRPPLYILDNLRRDDVRISDGDVMSQLNIQEDAAKASAARGTEVDVIASDAERLVRGFTRPLLLTLVVLDDNVRGWRVRRIGGLVMVRAVKRIDETDGIRRSYVNKDDDIQTTLGSKTVESESTQEAARDTWWHEVRDDVRSHCKFLGCNVVLGYTEQNTLLRKSGISILTGCGTAVVVEDIRTAAEPAPEEVVLVSDSEESGSSGSNSDVEDNSRSQTGSRHGLTRTTPRVTQTALHDSFSCEVTHLPSQFPRRIAENVRVPEESQLKPAKENMCRLCGRHPVSDVILTTCEPPPDLQVSGEGELIEVRVCREIKKFDEHMAQKESGVGLLQRVSGWGMSKGKKGKKEAQLGGKKRERLTKKVQHILAVTEVLPFAQYDLHKQLLSKLRVMGKNAVFRLDFQLALSSRFVVCTAVGTAVFVPSLPIPPLLRFGRGDRMRDHKQGGLVKLQQLLTELSSRNRAQCENPDAKLIEASISSQHRLLCHFGLHWWKESKLSSPQSSELSEPRKSATFTPSQASVHEVKAGSGPVLDPQRDLVVQVTDDASENLAGWYDPKPPPGFSVCNTDGLLGSTAPLLSSAQLLVAVRRVKWVDNSADDPSVEDLNRRFTSLLQQFESCVYFRLRLLSPGVALTARRLFVQLVDDESLQLILTGAVSSTGSPSGANDVTMHLEAFGNAIMSPLSLGSPLSGSIFPPKGSSSSPDIVDEPLSLHLRTGADSGPLVELTPMSYLPGAAIVRYVGRIEVHLIREAEQAFVQSYMMQDCAMSTEPALGGRKLKGAFTHAFIQEIHALVRAQVAALGGNVLLSYSMDEFDVTESSSTVRPYGLISISGDAFFAERPGGHEAAGVATLMCTSAKGSMQLPSISAFSNLNVLAMAGQPFE